MAPSDIVVRQTFASDGDDGNWWYYSETAFIIKWVVIAVIFLVLLTFFVGGYLHLQRRLKKGLPPLRYHRWMLNRRQRVSYYGPNPRVVYHHTPYGHGPAQNVPMQNWGPAPPAYGESDFVPPYPGKKPDGTQNPNNAQTGGPSGSAAIYR